MRKIRQMPPIEYDATPTPVGLSEFGHAVSHAGASFVGVIAGQVVLAVTGVFTMLFIERAWSGNWLWWVFGASILPWLILALAVLIRALGPVLVAVLEVITLVDLNRSGKVGDVVIDARPLPPPQNMRQIPVNREQNKPAMFYHAGVKIDPRDMWQFITSDRWSRSDWAEVRRPMESGGHCTRTLYDAIVGYLTDLHLFQPGSSGTPAQLLKPYQEIDEVIGCREKILYNEQRKEQFITLPEQKE